MNAAPLEPVLETMRAVFGTSTRIPGVAPDLLVRDETGWFAASRLGGDQLPALIERASHRWDAQPHVAMALAWKAYTYWLTLPAVFGFCAARRVPLLTGDDVLVRFDDSGPLVTLGLRKSVGVAVLAADPLAGRDVIASADENELLGLLRQSLLDQHLTPLLTALHGRVRLGSRILLGSVASGIANAGLHAVKHVPDSSIATIQSLLRALNVDDLVDFVPGQQGRVGIRRRTCCLAFALPPPKICGDCCID